jgi:hypothetical protein
VKLTYWSRVAVLLLAACFILAMIPGCVSLEAPKSFNERLAYGYAGVSASRSTATAMLERGRITVEEARNAQALADQSRAALDLARGAAGQGDMTTADGQLQLALTVLTSLETYLKGKQ